MAALTALRMKTILSILVTVSIACPDGFYPVRDKGTELCYKLIKSNRIDSLSAAMLSCQEYGKDTRLANLKEFHQIMNVFDGTWSGKAIFHLFAIKGFIPIKTIQDRSKPWFFYGEGMKSIPSNLWHQDNPDNHNNEESCLMMEFDASQKKALAHDANCVINSVDSALCVKDANYGHSDYNPDNSTKFVRMDYPYGLDDSLKSQSKEVYQMGDFDAGLQEQFNNITRTICLFKYVSVINEHQPVSQVHDRAQMSVDLVRSAGKPMFPHLLDRSSDIVLRGTCTHFIQTAALFQSLELVLVNK
ncbi:hypothetical protein Ciccas_006515 [Cichlidogyrus casuarinus]|uniref:C-type lectin domain-containing protein n=1 Tax=Cichlidogyrus casuarinus TaxID=1844966 RepID=A0ABD2Q5Q3_9PLAT